MNLSRRALAARLLACVPALAGGAAFAADAPVPAAAAHTDAAEPLQKVDLNEFVVEGNSVLPRIEVERAVYPFLGPGRAPGDIEAARRALEQAYQSRGYNSVVVELPAQQVRGGVVRLAVAEARIGRLRVEGAQYHSPRRIRESVPALAAGGVPDFSAAERQLGALNRGENLAVAPVLRPGREPDTLDLILQVDDRLPLNGTLVMNNEHSQDTDSLRTSATFSHSNFLQRGHSLSLTWLGAPSAPQQSQVISGSYLAPLAGTPWSLLGFGYTSDSEVVTLGSLSVLGKGHAVGLRALRELGGGSDWSASLNFGIDYKNFDESVAGLEAPLVYAPFSAGYSLRAFGAGATTDFGLTLTAGLRGLGSDAFDFDNKRFAARGNFVHLRGDFSRQQDAWWGTQWALRLSGQLAGQALVSGEQLAAGGVDSVRGYLQSAAVGDIGVIGSLEWRSPQLAQWAHGLQDWRIHVFVDGAHLRSLDPLPETPEYAGISSFGLGTRWTGFGWLTGELQWAMPMSAAGAMPAHEDRVHFQLSTGF